MYDATWLLRLYCNRRLRRLDRMDPARTQLQVLQSLIRRARKTRFGRDHRFKDIRTLAEYRDRVPVRDYDSFWETYWSATFPHLVNCTWRGRIPYFAQSSGTTRGTTKYIPVTREINRSNNRAGADLLAHHLASRRKSRILAGRSFMLGGSTGLTRLAPGVQSGDLSGIAATVMPAWTHMRVFPPRHLEGISDWEEKIDRLARHSLKEDIRVMGGVPSWMLLFFDRVMELEGVEDGRIRSVFPDLELLVHGGVAWGPYRERFSALLEGSHAETREVYPASEGFFGVADGEDGAGLRLLLDNEIFFEFVPVEELGSDSPECHWVGDLETDVNYALVVSTAAGLWRYAVGDTVTVVTRNPPRVLVTGRTSYMLSAFGEHVIGTELDQAVAEAAQAIHATVTDYAVGNRFSGRAGERGGHCFVVEFGTRDLPEPTVDRFASVIDEVLVRMNDDYAAHRAGGWGLNAPEILVMPRDGFSRWMKRRGKLGGQNKVPRVINDLELFKNLCEFIADDREGLADG